MKVIFLDIDGVLNGGSSELVPDENGDTLFVRACKNIDRYMLSNFCRVLIETGADVVVSSTWRKRFAPSEIADILVACGMPDELAGRFIGRTDELPVPYDLPDRTGKKRGLQIARWLKAHPGVTAFSIIDDGANMAHLMPHLVKTDWIDGLTAEKANEVIAKLLA